MGRAVRASCPRPPTATQRRDSESPSAISGVALACVDASFGKRPHNLILRCALRLVRCTQFLLRDMSYWLRPVRGRSLVLDPLEDLFPVNRDVLRCFDSETNVGTLHTKDRHEDVRTDPNGFANSPREHQHVSLHACFEMTIPV